MSFLNNRKHLFSRMELDSENTNLPSIFEVIAQENLSSSMRHGLRYLTQVLAFNYPENFGIIHQYFDEIYLIIDALIQSIHLSLHNSSFAEYFYNLRRVCKDSLEEKPLSRKHLIYSCLILVGFPYIRTKLDRIYQEIDNSISERKLSKYDNTILYRLFVIYPYICTLWDLNIFLYELRFASNQTITHSPLLSFIGLTLVKNNSKQAPTSIFNWFVKSLEFLLTSGAFMIQFLDYWYTRENRRTTILKTIIPPAPKKLSMDKCSDRCPICSLKRTQDTVLATSGYVFCYNCISQFVKTNRRCPITGYPSNDSHIVPIFASGR